MAAPVDQLRLALGPYVNRRLYADHFLRVVLPEWPEFGGLDAQSLLEGLRSLWLDERDGLAAANEAQTEERWIKPVLQRLGFAFTVQAGLRVASGRRQPDYALFLTEALRAEADGRTGQERYRHAIAVADAKRFARPLDRRRAGEALSEDPEAQIINYVGLTRRRWGILTNGRLWRLYDAEGDLVEGACYEVDLVSLLEAEDASAFRYFAAFFGSGAFTPGSDGRAFLERALDESRAGAVQVGDTLERQVFAAVPLLAEGLLGAGDHSPEELDQGFRSALVLLYRVLFCLHAEARGLLPVANPHYADYSLRRQRSRLADDIDRGRVFSSRSDDLYNDLRALFRIVDQGDPALGVNEYDGGLFSPRRNRWLEGRAVPDHLLSRALDLAYRVGGEQVDYGSLAIRHLGTIYERLLDFRLEAQDGRIALTPASGRHRTGAYFTPARIVDAIVERTLEPVLQRRSEAAREAALGGEEALNAFLGLRVLDPALGSGHFLVAAAAYMAQFIATDPSYDGDLPLVEIQRLVAERCLYGVDVNPMAVELARLSLWLATVRGDEPLTFLHNLRVGNSLVGVEMAELVGAGDDLFAAHLGRDADALLTSTAAIARRVSRTGADVHEKEQVASDLDELRTPLRRVADEALDAELVRRVGRPFHWELEYPEVFLGEDGSRRADGGFDAVIGNPPYIRIQELDRALASYCRREYESASGSFDAYVVFLERGLSLLRPDGRLGFIVPNKLVQSEYAGRLRARLLAERAVEELIDFGDAQLFAGATNYTSILVLDRKGVSELTYRRVRGDARAVSTALLDLDAAPSGTFPLDVLGGDAWVLAAGEEAGVLRAAATGSRPLGEVTRQIFQGLITSADPVYILEDRGVRGELRRVNSRASGEELELEPELLHPIATGSDVEPYAFRSLRRLLLFPYRRGEDQTMRLLTPEELAALPRTEAYLRGHEATLRSRERGKMDRAGWYGYVYPKSLGAHELPKLGVAATVRRLEVAADPGGEVYFHNVRVNGILVKEGGPSIWALLVLLNSRLLDFVFRRGAGVHAGGHFAANKQFIAPLPIREPDDPAQLDGLGSTLHELSASIARERRGFLDWLGGAFGARPDGLAGRTRIEQYDSASPATVIEVLRANRGRLNRDPDARTSSELVEREWRASLERLVPLRHAFDAAQGDADATVYDLYEISNAQRRLVDAEYR